MGTNKSWETNMDDCFNLIEDEDDFFDCNLDDEILVNDDIFNQGDAKDNVPDDLDPYIDLLKVEETKRKAVLKEGNYVATVGTLTAEKIDGKNGPFISVTIPFEITRANFRDPLIVKFRKPKSLYPKSDFAKIVTGILGKSPVIGDNYTSLKGIKVQVKIKHIEDQYGNVWEEVVEAKRISK